MISVAVCDDVAARLAGWAAGARVLEIGTAPGRSTAALVGAAASVTSVEPDARFAVEVPGAECLVGEWRDLVADREFDLVFVDHFPLEDREPAATYWWLRGADVVVDDANMLSMTAGHLHRDLGRGVRHLTLKECP